MSSNEPESESRQISKASEKIGCKQSGMKIAWKNIKTACNECKQHLTENFDYLCCRFKWCLKHDQKLLFEIETRKI